MTKNPIKASFITFFSFKGGVGRSMALINTAAIMAGRGLRVLVMDLDLEAPGLSYLTPLSLTEDHTASLEFSQTQSFSTGLGFVDLMLDAKEKGTEADLFLLQPADIVKKYTKSYTLPQEDREFQDGVLDIMPAGKLDRDYAKRFDDLNLRGLYQDGVGEPLIRVLKNTFANSNLYDYVLIDSRTGFSDEAGICTRDLADHLIILSGLNLQNVEGTSEFLKSLKIATSSKAKFQIILSPVPNGEDKLVEAREAQAKLSFEKAWGSEINLELQIPYHPQLSLTEEPHIFRRRRGHLFEAYCAIESKILRELGHDALSLQRKIKDDIAKNNYSSALYNANYLIRLPNKDSALSMIVFFLINPKLLRKDKKSNDIDGREFSFSELINDSNGIKLLELIIDYIRINKDYYAADIFLDFLENNNIDLAERLHQRRINIDQTIHLTHSESAMHFASYAKFLLFQRKDYEAADAMYKEALKLDPTHAGITGNYANFLADKRKDYEAAEAMYKKALELEPTHASHFGNYANFLADQRKDYEAANAMYKKALELDPTHAGNTGNYANFLAYQRKDYEAAEAMYKKALELDPTHAGNTGNYANFLAKQGKEEAAEAMYKKTLELDPTHADHTGNYAILLEKQGKDEATEAMYKKALELDPTHAGNTGNYANFLADQAKDYEAADVMYKKSLELDPTHAVHTGNYANFLADQAKDYEAADVMYKKSLELDPTHAGNTGNYANFLADQRKDYEAANAMYKKALELDPNDINIYANFAAFLLTYGKNSDWENARSYCEKVLLNIDEQPSQSHAEALLYLCLNAELNASDVQPSMARLKILLQHGYERGSWDFTALFGAVLPKIAAERTALYRALGDAILNKEKVFYLDQFKEWQVTATPQ
ncbi:KGGVGR-motif variant AAA ATPase [Massilia sp. S19_KUP03_FR1]|uniref:KGGVGR-motif variant AAA ATPase n=1 Tax=Massilia sp. S19_KUP03_FR1 TaxID=3025503 RepID=UPI002FCDBE8C